MFGETEVIQNPIDASREARMMRNENNAQTQYPIHDLIRERWSSRAFSSQMIGKETIGTLMEAARWAASSFNEQPWSFVLVTKEQQPNEFEKLLNCLTERNRSWAQYAPLLLLTVARLMFTNEDKSNRHAFYDVGLAVGNLTIQATALGLTVHQMGGFDVEKTRQTCGIPNGYEPIVVIAIGYPGEPASLPQPFREGEFTTRNRNPLETFVFSGEWGKASF